MKKWWIYAYVHHTFFELPRPHSPFQFISTFWLSKVELFQAEVLYTSEVGGITF